MINAYRLQTKENKLPFSDLFAANNQKLPFSVYSSVSEEYIYIYVYI